MLTRHAARRESATSSTHYITLSLSSNSSKGRTSISSPFYWTSCTHNGAIAEHNSELPVPQKSDIPRGSFHHDGAVNSEWQVLAIDYDTTAIALQLRFKSLNVLNIAIGCIP